MKKKTDNKPNVGKSDIPNKVMTAIKGETVHFIIGLLCVIFGVYMLLAFSSFFFTGGNDQSILSHPNPGELLETGNRIQNYAGARGAQLSQFLINDCFGISAYFIIAFFNCSRNEIDESIRIQSMEMVRIMHSFNDMVLHYF